MNGNMVTLAMNDDETYSGAITTQSQETYSLGASWSEQITLPCTDTGQIENWPAFWATATPAPGEIDILEGLHGYATWNVHYVNAQGDAASIQGKPPGNWCGTHTYTATWTSEAVTFTWDGRQVGQVTPAEMGVPMFTSPEQKINDYAQGTYGGPSAGGVAMVVAVP